MSTIDPQGLPTSTGTEQTQDQGGSQETYSLGPEFLSKVPDNERPIVEKYIKDWDAGVTKKFQEIHGQYAPFKELGDVDSLKQALQIAQLLEQNPQFVYNVLAEEFGQGQSEPKEPQPTQVSNLLQGFQQEQQPQIDPRVDKMEQMLNQLSQVVIARAQLDREAEEDRQLDSLMGDLHKRHGEFDEDFVLTRLYVHGDPEKAVQEFRGLFAKYGGTSGPPPPPALTGSGVVPGNTQSVAEMSDKDIKSLVAGIISQNARS